MVQYLAGGGSSGMLLSSSSSPTDKAVWDVTTVERFHFLLKGPATPLKAACTGLWAHLVLEGKQTQCG